MERRIDRTALAAELRTLTSLRSRSAVRDRVLPALDQVLGDEVTADRELRFATLQGRLDGAIAGMTDPAHRAAAAELLGSGPNRWQPLTRRGPRAASAFQLGWDAYRRRRETTGASLLDETLDELAATLLRTDAATGPATSDPPPPPDPEGMRSEEGPDRRTRFSPVAALVAAILVVAGVAVTVVAVAAARSDGDGGDADGLQCGQLTYAVGDGGPDATEIRPWIDGFRATAATLPDGTIRCAGRMTKESGVPVQLTTDGRGTAVAAIVGSTDGRSAIWLNPEEYRAFRTLAIESTNPERSLGAPVRRITGSGGARIVRYTTGTTYAESDDAPVRAVMGAMHAEWLRRGGPDGPLGAPLTDDYFVRNGATDTGIVQEFEGGRLRRSYQMDATYEVTAYGAGELAPPRADPAVVVSVLHNDTAWLVGADNVRRWIPDARDAPCVAETRGLDVIEGVAMIAITGFELGPSVDPCR